MKTPAGIITFFLIAAAFIRAEERPIRVGGIISQVIFAGPPNYESISDGDAPEKAWILTTSKNERIQLVVLEGTVEKFSLLRSLLGKRATITGSVWEAETGHHHTPRLITVSSIKEESETK